ncbi:MAG: winged helix-turn-helix domain-containing protein [Phycisphaerales bacterium]
MQKPPPYILDETVPRTGGQNFSSPGQGMGKVRMGPHDRPLAFISFNDLLAMCTCRVRLELLVSLSQRPMAVSDLARRRQLAVAHVSQYLRRLAAASLVEFSQQGPGRVYSVSQRFSASPSAKGLLLAIAGDDGSEVSILLPWKQAERLGYEQAPSVSWSPIRRIVSQEPLED